MSQKVIYDVVVVGGGPVGLATAYEVAKAEKTVLVLEQRNFFNQAGSSNDLARMFRTMYTEDYMADLAKDAMDLWDDLEKDAGVSLRWLSGLLNFGDPTWSAGSAEGTLIGPIKNLDRLDMIYKTLSVEDIEKRYPFKNLPKDWMGLWAPDNGVINVPLLLRTLYSLAKDYGAEAKQYRTVKSIHYNPELEAWEIGADNEETHQSHTYLGRKVVISAGAYTNHILRPSFGFSLLLNIWEMVASYFSVNPGPSGVVFPSMWFQFQPEDPITKRSNLFYGFPAVPWGPANVARIAVDAATRIIHDPDQRLTSVVNPEDIANTQAYIKNHIIGVDSTVPAFTLSCMQTNVDDNNFVLDYIPEDRLGGGPKNSVALFTAGWAMKFVPTLGKVLKEMVIDGGPKSVRPAAMKCFEITRDKVIAPEGEVGLMAADPEPDPNRKAQGSSMR